jgi:glutathione S-transferase
MDFYYFPTSHWSRILSVVLAEKGIEPTRHVVDITQNASFDPDYVRLNPRGVVPTLVDDGEVIYNGPTIAKYVDAKAPGELFPADPEVECWAKRLEDFPVMLFSYSVWVLGNRGEKSATILDDKIERARKYAEKYPDLAPSYQRKQAFFEEFRAQVYDEDYVAAQERECRQLLDELGQRLSKQDWVCGDYSFPDAILTSILFRLVDLGKLDHWHGDESHGLDAYFERLKARPSYRKVYVDDPLIPDKYKRDA